MFQDRNVTMHWQKLLSGLLCPRSLRQYKRFMYLVRTANIRVWHLALFTLIPVTFSTALKVWREHISICCFIPLLSAWNNVSVTVTATSPMSHWRKVSWYAVILLYLSLSHLQAAGVCTGNNSSFAECLPRPFCTWQMIQLPFDRPCFHLDFPSWHESCSISYVCFAPPPQWNDEMVCLWEV